MKKVLLILKSIYADYLNKRGFTLIEMLVSFSVFAAIIFFISPIFQFMQNSFHLQNRIQMMEWELFCSQMKKEIRMSTNAQVTGNTLILTEDAGTVVYEPYQQFLRRRVNYTGHEILLQNVSGVKFTRLKNAVRADIKDLNGKDYSVTAFSFIDWNGVP